MCKQLSLKMIFGLISFIFIMYTSIVFADWSESIFCGNGSANFSFDGNYIFEIQNSPYVVMYSGADIMTIDSNRLKIRSCYTSTHEFRDLVAISDPTGGWNIYFYDDLKFGKIHVDESGQFSDDKWLPRKPEIYSPSFGIPERNEIWYFSTKILRLSTIDDSWTEFNYPEDWDSNFDWIGKIYPVLSNDAIICIAFGKSIEDFQALLLNIDTGSSKLINAEEGFFDYSYITDIDEWMGHSGCYLIMKAHEIYSFDSNTGIIELLIESSDFVASKIMQDEFGMYLYVLDFTNRLYVLDLINRTLETHEISLDEGFHFVLFGPCKMYYDSIRNRIITWIKEDYFGDYKLVIIDLDDYTHKHIKDGYGLIGDSWMFLEEDNKVLFSSSLNIHIADLETLEIKNSLPITYNAVSWSIVDDMNKSILLGNSVDSDFIRILPNYHREMNNAGSVPDLVCQFPDGKNALIGEFIYSSSYSDFYSFKFYCFDDCSSHDIDFLESCKSLITDSKNNQIIAIFYQGAKFISPDLTYISWSPSEDLKLEDGRYIYDRENSILWLIYLTQDGDYINFFKISSKTKSMIDSFNIQYGDLGLGSIQNVVHDPDSKYLYFIEVTNSRYQRNLAVLDTDGKNIVKNITLQTEVNNSMVKDVVFPGIIPVPEKNKIFLWDHYGGWSIDTNTWNIVYGDTKSNPRAFCYSTTRYKNPNVKGTYISDSYRIIIIDYSIDSEGTGSDHSRCLEIDLETGSIMKEFEKPVGTNNVFFSKDKERIIYLDQSNSLIKTEVPFI